MIWTVQWEVHQSFFYYQWLFLLPISISLTLLTESVVHKTLY